MLVPLLMRKKLHVLETFRIFLREKTSRQRRVYRTPDIWEAVCGFVFEEKEPEDETAIERYLGSGQ